MHTPFDAELPNMTWGVVYILRQPRLSSQMSRVPAHPNFVGSPIFMPTPFNARPNLTW